VVRVDADLADAVHAHVAQQQVRPRVERTARLEHRELEREARRQRRGIDRRVDVQRRDRPHAAEHLADDPIEPVAERVDVLRLDREARGHRVTAVLGQQVTASRQGFGDVHARNAPARALPVLAVEGDDAGRPAMVLDQPRGGQSDDTGLPRRIGDNRRPRIGVRGRGLARAAHDVVREALPFEVLLFELVRQRLGLVGLLGEEESERVLGVRDAAGRVEARSETEADVRCPDAAKLHARSLRECPHPDDRRSVQRRKPRGHDRAVRRAERHDVRDGRERAELEELVLLHRVREIAQQPLREPERDAGPGQLLVVRRVVGAARVHERVRLREDGRRMMVVRDDEVDPELAGERRFGHGGHAAVDGHDDLGAISGELAQRRPIQAVTLLIAIRDVRADRHAKVAERPHEDG